MFDVLRLWGIWQNRLKTCTPWKTSLAWWWASRRWWKGKSQFCCCVRCRLLFFFLLLFSIQPWPFSFTCRSVLSSDITDLAKEVHDVLSAPVRPETQLRTPVQPMRRNKPQFFINSSNKKAKTVTLHIQGLEGMVSGWIEICVCYGFSLLRYIMLYNTMLQSC